MDKNKNILFAGIFIVSIIALYIALEVFVFSESTTHAFNTAFALLLGVTAGIVPLLIWRHYKTQKNRQYLQEKDDMQETDKADIEEKAMNAGIFFGGMMAAFFALNATILYPNDPNLLAKAIIGGVIGGGAGYIFYISYKKIYKKKLFTRKEVVKANN